MSSTGNNTTVDSNLIISLEQNWGWYCCEMTGQVGWRESSLWIRIHGDMLTNLKTIH